MKRCRSSGNSPLLNESGTRRDGPPAAQRHRDRRDTGAMRADAAVRAGRIAEIGRQLSLRADLEQDVGGRIVCPGFIDAHTHDDLAILDDPDHAQTAPGRHKRGARQLWPRAPVGDDLEALRSYSRSVLGTFEGEWAWRSFEDYGRRLDRLEEPQHDLPGPPHGALRTAVAGFDKRRAAADDRTTMCTMLWPPVRSACRSGSCTRRTCTRSAMS